MELGHIPLYAVCRSPSQARCAREQSEESEHGHVVGGSSRQHEESRQCEEQRYIQPEEHAAGHTHRRRHGRFGHGEVHTAEV